MRNIYNTCRDNLCSFTFAFDQIDLDKKGNPQIEKLKAVMTIIGVLGKRRPVLIVKMKLKT